MLPLGVTAAAPATDKAIQSKIYELVIITLIIESKEPKDTMKKVKSLEYFGLLVKRLKIKQKSQKVDLLACY